MSQRIAFLDWLLRQENRTTLWGAKGEGNRYDCSGLVTSGLVQVGLADWRQSHNADRLWHELAPVDRPAPGDLVFYGTPDEHGVNHVMVWWGDGRVFGACGASKQVLTVEDAQRLGARVRFRGAALYRRDLRGYRRSPFTDEGGHVA